MNLFHALMWPSNAVCNRLGLIDEHERGMVRMLVNMLLLTVIAVVGFVVLLGSL